MFLGSFKQPSLVIVLVACLTTCDGRLVAQQGSGAAAVQGKASSLAEARRLLQEGRVDDARKAVLDELRRSPRSAEAYDLLGILYIQRKDFEKAVAAFQRALDLDPRSTAAHNNLGSCYLEQQKYELARKEFETTLRLSPHDRDANYNLGTLYLAEHKPQQAITFFQRVRPPDLSTQLNLARAFLEAGQTAPALDLPQHI